MRAETRTPERASLQAAVPLGQASTTALLHELESRVAPLPLRIVTKAWVEAGGSVERFEAVASIVTELAEQPVGGRVSRPEGVYHYREGDLKLLCDVSNIRKDEP